MRTKNAIILLIVIFILNSSCGFVFDQANPEITPEFFAEQEKPFFACYIDDEIFHNSSEGHPFVGQLEMLYYPPDYPDTILRAEYPYFSLIVNDYSDIEDHMSASSIIISTECDTGTTILIDTIPFEYNFYKGMPELLSITYNKSYHTGLESSEISEFFYRYPNEIHFTIDSVIYKNGIVGNSYDVYGKLEGVISNCDGDTIRITNGLFRLPSLPF